MCGKEAIVLMAWAGTVSQSHCVGIAEGIALVSPCIILQRVSSRLCHLWQNIVHGAYKTIFWLFSYPQFRFYNLYFSNLTVMVFSL